MVLVAYLDDSGKDPQNRDTCIGGYAAPEATWEIFEREAEPIFQEYIGDQPLHAKDLYHGHGIYDGWRLVKKQAFVAKICLKLYPLEPLLGVSFSVRKASYARRSAEAMKRGFRNRTVTPYTFCMTSIFNWLMSDVRVGKIVNEKGLALILEEGNEHNKEARQALDTMRNEHGLDLVKSMSFVPKTACRAIQMADLFAYYTRRHNRKINKPGEEPKVDAVLKVLLENVRQRSFVATDFGPDIKASRFLAGNL